MWKMCLAVCLVMCAWCTCSQAADVNVSGSGAQAAPTRFASLRNMLGQPDGAMYSQGGYAPAPADGCGCNSGKVELDSPNCCAGIWSGYQARPCGHHRHYAGAGCGSGGSCGGTYTPSCNGGCFSGCGFRGFSGCCGGAFAHGWGGYGGPAAYGALGCGCGCAAAPTCGCSAAPACGCDTCGKHHCHLFGKHCRRNSCGCDTARLAIPVRGLWRSSMGVLRRMAAARPWLLRSRRKTFSRNPKSRARRPSVLRGVSVRWLRWVSPTVEPRANELESGPLRGVRETTGVLCVKRAGLTRARPFFI